MYLECRHCSSLKPRADFPTPPGKQCKVCRKKAATKRTSTLIALGRCYIHKNAESVRWNLCQKCVDYRTKRQQVKTWKRHGIDFTPEQYNELFAQQKGLCALCGLPQKEGSRRLAVEHCHKTGRIRGLVHFRCNVAIAVYEEGLMSKVQHYLQPWTK